MGVFFGLIGLAVLALIDRAAAATKFRPLRYIK